MSFHTFYGENHIKCEHQKYFSNVISVGWKNTFKGEKTKPNSQTKNDFVSLGFARMSRTFLVATPSTFLKYLHVQGFPSVISFFVYKKAIRQKLTNLGSISSLSRTSFFIMATLCANLHVEMDSWTGQKDKQS